MDRWRCVAVSAGVGVQECGSAGAGEQLCRSSCAALPVQLCCSGAGAAVQVPPSPGAGRGSAGGGPAPWPRSPARAGPGRAAGRSPVNHSLAMLW